MTAGYPNLPPFSPSPPPAATPEDHNSITDPRNAHILSVPQNKHSTYDFSPFLYAPAVQDRIQQNRHKIPLVSPISQTRIPSPLAENLHPSVIKDVHDFLLGKGKYSSPYCRNYAGNGKEVWRAWKRAWDIWNNNYMEGRVNELWVSRAYAQWEAYIAQQARKGKKPFEGPGGRKQLRRQKTRIGKTYRTESKALEQLEASIDDVAQGREDFKKRAIADLKARFKRNRNLGNGYIEYSEQLEEWQRRNWYQPRWEDYKDYKNRSSEYLPLTIDYVYDGLHGDEQERVKQLLHVDFWKKEPKLEAHRGTIEYAIALAYWEEQPEVRRCRLTGRPNWITMQPVEDQEEKYIESAVKRTSPAVVDEFRELMQINRKLGIGYIEYSWQLAHYNINMQAHAGEIDPVIQELEKPDPADYIDKAHPGKPDESTEPVTAIDREEEEDDQDEGEIDPNHLTRPLVIEDDGSSGGFFAMKDFTEYAVPDEDDASFEEYYDPIENSVWRPIQVREQEVKIDMDEDTDAFLRNSQFEIDGGVDCGRSPYPLLRPLYRYAQSKIDVKDPTQLPQSRFQNDLFDEHGSLLKLKKTWDEVTGTIFNIPTKSIYSQTLDKIEDRDHTESFEHHFSYQNPDIFPLDIRRCEEIPNHRQRGGSTKKALDPSDTDKIIQPSFNMKEKEYRSLRFDDPWWVEMHQKRYRDLPPRNYPPKFDESESYLPKDDKLWKDEVKKDSDLKSRYFVANLDGRLLKINGIEVGKGEIAGPLPEFAIIITEGDGVSFWFGVGGRFYLQPAGARTMDWSRQWNQLRRSLDDEYFGVPAGYFWQNAIVGKIMDDDEGEGEQDPKWIRWIKAKPERLTSAMDAHEVDPSNEHEDWGAPGPLPFESPEAELKWVAAQLHFQNIYSSDPWLKAQMVEPTGETAWGGLEDDYQSAADGPTDTAKDEWWTENKHDYENVQRLSGETFEMQQEDQSFAGRAAEEASSLKRKAEHDGYFPPDAKRFREDIEKRESEKIQEIEKQEEQQLDKGLQELVDQINKGAKEIAEADGEDAKAPAQWHPASGDEAQEQAKEALQKVREFERLRVLFNERRKAAKDITIPPMKNPIAGLAPSTVLTLPENRWALEAIVKNKEDFRLDQEVQETAAWNNQNASERLKRKRLAEKRKRGDFGFTAMTEAEKRAQERELHIKAQEEKEGNEVRELKKALDLLNARKKKAEMDKQHAELVKSGMKDGDPVKAEAAAEKSIEEAAEEQSKIADQFAILAWAKLNGVTSEQIFDHMSESGKEFNSDDFSSLINKGARENRDHEKIESAKTAASTMGWSLTEWCQRLHGVNTPEEYLEKLGKIKEPEYMLTENAAQSKRLFREKLLCDAYGPGETSKGEFHSWDDVVLSMPFTEDWDALVGSGKNVEPTEYTLVPRMLQVNQFDGKELWVGVL